MEYTFSFYHRVDRVDIRHPKWWQVWKKAEVVWSKQTERKSVAIDLAKYDFLEDEDFRKLLLGLFEGIHSMQLEQASIHTAYIKTYGFKVEDPATNLLKNSEG
jgi:hypothetical protein